MKQFPNRRATVLSSTDLLPLLLLLKLCRASNGLGRSPDAGWPAAAEPLQGRPDGGHGRNGCHLCCCGNVSCTPLHRRKPALSINPEPHKHAVLGRWMRKPACMHRLTRQVTDTSTGGLHCFVYELQRCQHEEMVMFDKGEQYSRSSHDVGRWQILFNDKERCLPTDPPQSSQGVHIMTS